MERRTRSVHPKDDAMKTRICGRSLFVWGLSATLFSLPLAAGNAWGGELKSSNPQEVQQTRNVTGKVLDENGEPMIGVSVLVKGTQKGTITDFDGNFRLDVPSGATELQLMYVGYKAHTVRITSGNMVVRMEPDNQLLDEVVVIGYGTMKKRDLTGAISSVKSEDIKMAPVANAMEALQGKIAGLDISRSSGRAGESPTVLLRGNRSLTASNEPLYIIDGIAGNIDTLNPNDIESIEVLKDASSTAIYGSAGANGVILVTTKQATQGKIQVDFDAYYGVNTSPQYPSALTGQAWLDYLEEGYLASTGSNSASQSALLSAYGLNPEAVLPYIQNNKWVDWVDETLRTGTSQNYSINLRGGTEKLNGYFSLGYVGEQGVYRHDENDTYSMRTGATLTATKWLKAGIQSTFAFTNRDRRSSRINRAFSTLPLGDVYDENGDINVYPVDGLTSRNAINLLADDVSGVYKNNRKALRATINPYIEITPLEGLTFKSTLGTTITSSRTGEYSSENTYLVLTGSGTANKNASYTTSLAYNYTWQNVLTYNFSLADKHDFTITGITEYAHSQSENSYAYNENLGYDQFIYFNLADGSNPTVTSGYEQTKKMSYAIRLNYSFLGRYLFSVSNRWDGASQLYNKWDSFPAVSVGWRISDEPFMASTQRWLSNLKLRVGYGVTGNANIDPYQITTQITNSDNSLNLGSGTVSSYVLAQAIGNVDLGWEKSYNTNVGLDVGLFNNRVDLSVDYYYTDTKDVLWQRDLPTAYGVYASANNSAYTMMQNIAEISNRGVELTLNSRNIETKNFTWNSTLTFAWNKEKVESIDLGSGTTVDELISEGLFIGEPVNTLYGLKKIGIWQLGEEEDAAVFGAVPGDVKIDVPGLTHTSTGVYTDADGNVYTADNVYSISDNDRQILGHTTPDWTLGFQNTFTYKDFDLTVFMNMRWGQTINASLLGYFSYGQINIPSNYNYWTPENPTNDFPRPNVTGDNDTPGLSSLSYVDGSYLKIKTITLGYSLPKKVLNKIGLSRCRFYATVYNPFIWSKSHLLKDMDPETNGSDSFPLYKTMVFGVNVSF